MLNLKDLLKVHKLLLQEGVMLKNIPIIICLFFTIYSAPANSTEGSFKKGLRSYIIKFLGEDTATSILGTAPDGVELPEIPKVNRSALDQSVFKNEKDIKEENIPESKKKKLDYYFIEELYTATRNTKANKNDLLSWFSILSQGGTREGVYRALVLDNTYRGLENYDNPVNASTVEFASYFYSRFLNKKIKKKAIEGLNFYTLKRITVKNSLEVADEYLKGDKESFYKWYAVFSGELAREYPKAWKNKLRKTTKMKYHKKWAETVPDQQIKSEIIIKIHKVYNFLK